MQNIGNIKKYGLLGYPLGHSLSHFIHRRIFQLCGITDCEYDLYEVKPDELSLKGGSIKELSGFNVTIPYKTQIIPFLNRLDASAEQYGAVNCVKYIERDGEYIGYNTDGYGFKKSIEELGASLNSKILLLGCGGTGRMMAIEAIKAGADLTLAIRRSESAQKAAAKLSQEIREITGEFFAKTSQLNLNSQARLRITYIDQINITNSYDLLINATPSGMFPDVDEMPIPPDILGKVDYLFDAIYNPCPTKLITEAEKRGVKTLGGMPMLVYQAAMAETIWHSENDMKISNNIIRNIIEECKQQL